MAKVCAFPYLSVTLVFDAWILDISVTLFIGVGWKSENLKPPSTVVSTNLDITLSRTPKLIKGCSFLTQGGWGITRKELTPGSRIWQRSIASMT